MARFHRHTVIAALALISLAAAPPAVSASKRVARAGAKVAGQAEAVGGAPSAAGAAGAGVATGGGLLANGWLIALAGLFTAGAVTAVVISGDDDSPVSPAS